MINGISRKFGLLLAVGIGVGLLGGGLFSRDAKAVGDFANVVTVCGTIDYSGSIGLTVPMTMDIAGNLCGNGSGGTSSGSFGNNADGSTPIATGLGGTKDFGYGYDPTGAVWNRISLNPNQNAVAVPIAATVNSILSTSMIYGRSVAGTGIAAAEVGATTDGQAGQAGLFIDNQNTIFNGSTWDRQRGNVDSAASILTLAAQAPGTVTSSDQTNFNGRGVKLGINITADSSGTALVVVTIQGKDTVSGMYYTILTSASLATVAFSTLTVYPAITATANVAVSDVLPRTWRVSVIVSGAGTASATVGSITIL